MSTVQPLCLLLDLNPKRINKTELIFLEAELFVLICEELKETIKHHNKDYFRLLNFTIEEERLMLETKFIRFIINDIIATDEYTLHGIALYTGCPEDVIYELASGRHSNPTFHVSRKIIELHRLVRPDLYQSIAEKIKQKCLREDSN